MKCHVLVVFDFNERNIPLQPWKYLFELAKYLQQKGEVHILTNGPATKNQIEGLPVCHVSRISPGNWREILKKIHLLNATAVYWWASSRTYFYKKLFGQLNCPINLLYTGSVYYNKEIIPVLPFIGRANIKSFLPELVIPHALTRKLINSKCVERVVTISQRNRDRFISMGCIPDKIIVTGIGKEEFGYENELRALDRNPNSILYLTSASKIRGIELLITAFAGLVARYPALTLRILARPTSGNNTKRIRQLCSRLGLNEKVIIVEGWLTKNEILYELATCRALVMPFLLVHSEMPISIMEAFSVGTPVIAPDLDGITELVENRGVTYCHYRRKGLQNAIEKLINNDALHWKLSVQAYQFWRSVPHWPSLFHNQM
jgi:Glycosyltransferase